MYVQPGDRYTGWGVFGAVTLGVRLDSRTKNEYGLKPQAIADSVLVRLRNRERATINSMSPLAAKTVGI